MVGDSKSETETENEHEEERPPKSEAERITVESPSGKEDPEGIDCAKL
jgi:hypothetical protein